MIKLLDHNLPTYEELKHNLIEHDKVALLQATGTGKSYIVGKYIEETKLNTLILVPTLALQKQWRKVTDSEIITYSSMVLHIADLKKYELIIADEFHHLGSEVWGETFKNELLNCGAKIIGCSATEIRYLDNSRNMADELFEGNVVNGLDLATAIETGILPAFTYVSVAYGNTWADYTRKLSQLKRNTKHEILKEKLDFTTHNLISVEKAIKRHMVSGNHKIIVFMNNVKTVESECMKIADIFGADNVFKATYRMSNKNIEKTISDFEESDAGISILFAINILNEGLHIDDVDCVVFMRNTQSPQIYFQQLGRCLNVGKNVKPIVFDLVCNSSSIRAIYKDDDIHKLIVGNYHRKNATNKIILFDYVKELNDLFEEIDSALGGKPYTDEEIDFIRNHPDMNVTELSRELGRSTSSIYQLATKAGVKLKKHHTKVDEKVREYILSQKGIKSEKKLAEELGISQGTVATILHPASLQKRKQYRDKENKTKRVINMLDDNNKVIRTFDSVSKACREIGTDDANFYRALKRGGKCKGYRFEIK